MTFTHLYIPKILRSELGNPYYVPDSLMGVFQDQEPSIEQRMEMIRLQGGMTAPPSPMPQQEQKSNMALALMTVGVITSVIGLGLQIASFRRSGV